MKKIKIGIKQLNEKLNILNGVIAGNSVLPILEMFLLEVDGKELKITATDMQNTMTTKMEVESSENIKICIPARLLSETIKILPVGFIEIVVKDNYAIELHCNQGKYKFVGANPEDFPAILEIEGKEIMLESTEIEDVLKHALFSISDDDLRPAMTGLFFQFNDKTLNFVSTDARRLTKIEMVINDEKLENFIVPKKSLLLLKNSLKSTDLFIKANETNVVFRYDENVLISRLVDAKFPQYEGIIPENENIINVNRNEILNAIKRVMIFSNKTTFMSVFTFSAGKIEINTEDQDFSNAANEIIENVDYAGPEIKIGFNSKFIVDILQNIETELVQIELTDGRKAAIFRSGENVLMLAMPLQIG